MKTRNKRRIDHFVPESYLKGFTNCESKFYVWEKLASKPIDYMYPAQNCWLDHYYEIAPNDLKRKIGEVESDFIERYAFKLYEDHIQNISKVFTYRPEKIPIDIFLYLCQGLNVPYNGQSCFEESISVQKPETLIGINSQSIGVNCELVVIHLN